MLDKINEYIEKLPLEIEPKGLYEPIRYVLSLGGKRVRPMLMMMTYEMWKENGTDILPQAVALETYHNFTLLHDDVMDKADVRRGKPTVHKKWNENTAILSGDNMLVLAFQWMMNMDKEQKVQKAVMDVFTQTAIEIGHGQQYDVDFETRNDVTEDEYMEMIRLKTSVLLACATKIGALMAGASKEDTENMYHFGEYMGLAFQLQDDYLDVFGDPKVFGKEIGGDILNNKKTYMLINALLKAQGDDKEALEKWINATTFDKAEKIAAVTALYVKLGIDKMAKEKMDEYYKKAIQAIDKVSVDEERKHTLRSYAAKMMKREK